MKKTIFHLLLRELHNKARHPKGRALLILTFPLWLSLFIVALALVAAFFFAIWLVPLLCWVLEAAFGIGILGGGLLAYMFLIDNAPTGFALICATLVWIGITIYAFYGCVALTKATAKLTQTLISGIQNKLIEKEDIPCVNEQKSD